MIVMNMIGGLGNQMFQYATGLSLAMGLGTELRLDISDFGDYDLRKFELGVFDMDLEYATEEEVSRLIFKSLDVPQRLYFRLTGKRLHPRGSYFHWHDHPDAYFRILEAGIKDAYLFGHWQDERHFIGHREEVLRAFTPRAPLSKEAERFGKRIDDSVSVSMHIRRGDYISDPDASRRFATCGEEYYRRAVDAIGESVDDPVFFIFSDDLEWVRENFDWLDRKTLVEGVPEAYEEMMLMARCDHNIIANSSFSWWGAWLNRNPDRIVIAPREWYRDKQTDIVPPEWVRI